MDRAPHRIVQTWQLTLAQLAQLIGVVEFFRQGVLRKIKGLVGSWGRIGV
jgi:hypothetical protein